jgi:hypothetical protein
MDERPLDQSIALYRVAATRKADAEKEPEPKPVKLQKVMVG